MPPDLKRASVIGLAGEGTNLCLAGGLFFNALLVEALERSGRWKQVFVQPAAGNAGTALGAAQLVGTLIVTGPDVVTKFAVVCGTWPNQF